jgi:hypothetical protein
MDPETETIRTALVGVLDPDEVVDRVVPAVGCSLVLTDRRVLLVRDGAVRRPKTGVQAWPLDRELTIRIAPGQPDRLVIERKEQSASIFLAGQQVDEARGLILEARRRSHSQV